MSIFHCKVAHPDFPERRQKVTGGNQPLPDWLGGGEAGVTELPALASQTEPTPTVSLPSVLATAPSTASMSLSQPMGEFHQSYRYIVFVLELKGWNVPTQQYQKSRIFL
jgi:hypothetical protein